MRFVRSRALARVFAPAAVGFALTMSGVLLAPGEAAAQSAADKATARKLALEGIELFEAGNFTEALERLSRAQQLYDAPIHLVYMARSQAKLGQYIEAAENYRRLVRTQLEPNAPQAFKDAVADAKKELPDVEPKVAGLKLDVKPAGIQGLEVKIDDQPLSSAALGVERPTNPGGRKLSAKAPGYKSFEKTLELKPGERKAFSIELEEDETAAVGAGGTTGGTGAGGDSGVTDGDGTVEASTAGIGFIVGLRLGGALPTGDLREGYPMKDWFGAGGTLELRGGVRFAQRYTALLFFAGHGLTPGSKIDKTGGPGSTATTRATAIDAGAGFMYSAPPGKLGPFAELDIAFIHRFEATRDLVLTPTFDGGSCKNIVKASGTGIRLAGGVQIPIAGMFQISPFAGILFGQARDFSSDDGSCKFDGQNDRAAFDDTSPWYEGQTEDAAYTTHMMVQLGVGGDLVFGKDKPTK